MTPGKLSSYSDLELALMILQGCYGNGAARRQALGSRYNAAQGIVEQILATGRVPDGKGSTDPDQIRKAVSSVFNDTIKEITEEVMNKL
jgi:hypothetical protein